MRPAPALLGADDRARTGDLNLGKVALYQLSYVRVGLHSSPVPGAITKPHRTQAVVASSAEGACTSSSSAAASSASSSTNRSASGTRLAHARMPNSSLSQ